MLEETKETKNELMAIDERNTKNYTNLDMSLNANKVKVYNVMQKCDIRLNDIVNSDIKFDSYLIIAKDVDVEDEDGNKVINETTGEVETKRHYRTILFDGDTSYVTASYGIYNSLKNIISLFGEPSVESPFKVKVQKVKSSKSGYESLSLLMILDNE